MSTITTTIATDLQDMQIPSRTKQNWQAPIGVSRSLQLQSHDEEVSEAIVPPIDAVDAIPNGGYGWTVVSACGVLIFWTNGWTSTWGVLQAAMLRSNLLEVETSTLSFVGSLALGCLVAFGIVSVRLLRSLGARNACLAAVILFSMGPLLTSFTLDNVGGLFCTAGAMVGIGASVIYTACNSLPVQWFSSRLGTANGLVKVGGGLGATILPVAAQGLINTVGIPWTFRISSFLMLATGIPCALVLRDRAVIGQVARIDWSMFKNVSFLGLCLTGAVGTFALFVPPFFLPLFARSIGLSASTGAALVAGFGLSTTVGRLIAGFGCDQIGSLNTLSITMLVNAISMLAIWPVSSTLAPLVLFAAMNGLANGAFFVACPVAVAHMVEPGRASIMMGLNSSTWVLGYLFGSPIAGVLISSTGADKSSSIEPYRGAIFYAGGVALLGGAFVMVARLTTNTKLLKKM